MNRILIIILACSLWSCGNNKKQNQTEMADTLKTGEVTLMTLDPGHFHAALVQKEMYEGINPDVYVFAPEGPELQTYLSSIQAYNTRPDNPTHWNEKIYTGPDYLEKMLQEKPGNVVVISGNNAKKTEYILKSAEAGLNVLADKPMVISPDQFNDLVEAFRIAGENHTLLYDIMTERYEITTILQKQLSLIPEIFGKLEVGTPEKPAVTKESVHHFFKYVSGKPVVRPTWYFDVSQQGEGIVDVSTHLVDLIQWECFPGQILDYPNDIQMLSAKRWTTPITPEQFKTVTGTDSFPSFLDKDVKDNMLNVYSNGEMTYRIKGVCARVSVIWKFQAPEGAGDTHYSIMRGSNCNLIIQQGKEENYRPELYVEKTGNIGEFEKLLTQTVNTTLQDKFPGISVEKISNGKWRINIPDSYRNGHEAHFGQVMEKFLGYLKNDDMPDWEVPDMIAKYYTTMEALKMAKGE